LIIRIRPIILLACLALHYQSGFAQESQSTPSFPLTGARPGAGASDGPLELDNLVVAGSTGNSMFGWWPKQLVVAPVPGYSAQLGWSLALGGAWFLDDQSDSKAAPSLFGAFAFASDNGSTAFGAGGMFHLREDQYRVAAGAGFMDVQYRYYGVGNEQNRSGLAIDIQQEAPAYFGSFSTRVWKRMYVGMGYMWSDVETRLRLSIEDALPDFDPAVELEVAALLVPIEWDSRDHALFPRDGWHVTSTVTLYRESVGSDFDATTISVAANRYIPMRETDVLAVRGYFHTVGGDAPFFLLSSFGGGRDLRGYPSGRYRDRMMYAMQGEYRWQFHKRWILTGFAGFGEVASGWSEFGDNLLPAAGAGIRFVLSEAQKMSLSADIAKGKDGYEFYFGVNEAF